MVYILVIITHVLHITNHAGPSVWAAIHVLHSGHFFSVCPPLSFDYRNIEIKPPKSPAGCLPDHLRLPDHQGLTDRLHAS